MVRRLIFAALAAILSFRTAMAADVRIASINLCTDQLLLDLADPGQIVGLSPFARDAARSSAAAKAAGVPILSGTAEEIMFLAPSHVLAAPFMKRETRDLIRKIGVPIETFDIVRTVAEAREQIKRVARLVERPARGVARVEELDAALERLKAAGIRQRLRVLPYARRGWAAGRESLIAEMLAAAGLVHAGGEAFAATGSFVSLETVVYLRPDVLLITGSGEVAEDQGQALLLHPAVQALFPPERRIVIPERLANCGGPELVEAMDSLARQIGRLQPRG
jgi:iron complex transport system substrate-binding protein